MRTVLSIAVIWIVCGVINYGATLAHFQNLWPPAAANSCRQDHRVALISALYGPLGVSPVLSLSDFYEHGIQFQCGVTTTQEAAE